MRNRNIRPPLSSRELFLDNSFSFSHSSISPSNKHLFNPFSVSGSELGAGDPKSKKHSSCPQARGLVMCDHAITALSTLIKEAQRRATPHRMRVRELAILNRVSVDKREMGEEVQTEGTGEGEGMGCPGTLAGAERGLGGGGCQAR